MKLRTILGLLSSILFIFTCSLTLPNSDKREANDNNLLVAALGSLIPTSYTSYVLVPNLDTTMPYLSIIGHKDGTNIMQSNIILDANPGDSTATKNDHIFANLTNANKVAVINITSNGARLAKYIDAGSRPVHVYQDPDGKIWTMNDGNSGVDNINSACNTAGVGSVTIMQDGVKGAADSDIANIIKHLCVGKGHHKAIFTASPKRAFVSNISDNSVSVIDNDSTSGTYLTVLNTISLGSGAGPHGFSYSSISGKVYISAQTAGNLIAVNPSTLTTETITLGKSGPSSVSPSGQYIAVPGKDTATDADHVIGKVTIVNVSTNIFSTVSIIDISPSTIKFSHDGNRMYVSSAQAGTGNQVTNLKQNVLLVYDSSNLPSLTLLAQVTVGDAKTGHRHIASASHGSMEHIFVPAGDGILYTVDSETNTVTQKLELGGSFSNAFFHTLGSTPNHSH